MKKNVAIIGAGLAGSEAAFQLAKRGFFVDLFEMRPLVTTPVHKTSYCAELVCSNSLKSTKPQSAEGMLKQELKSLGSVLFAEAERFAVPAGGALAVDRELFAASVSNLIERDEHIRLIRKEISDILGLSASYDAVIVAAGPLASNALSDSLSKLIRGDYLAFFDAAAPIVMADSLNFDKLFRQSRYDRNADLSTDLGDYLNAPFTKDEYEHFIDELLSARRVLDHDFKSKDLFQACQPIEEIARAGRDAPRFGPLKPVGLLDPRSKKRPWAVLQLRAENACKTSYNLVGFQTNLAFPEQKRVFSLIPGLENAEFARFGVMHRNTFVDAPRVLDANLRLTTNFSSVDNVFLAGQISGTEGYCEAIRSGLHAAISVASFLQNLTIPQLPSVCVFGALLAYATDSATKNYQPMHVNFGILEPLDSPIKNKQLRYEAYAKRATLAFDDYLSSLRKIGLLEL